MERDSCAASIADMKGNYEKLGVTFDLWYGESDADRYIPRLMDMHAEKNLLVESDGALIVEVAEPEDKAPMPPVIVVNPIIPAFTLPPTLPPSSSGKRISIQIKSGMWSITVRVCISPRCSAAQKRQAWFLLKQNLNFSVSVR